MMRRGAEATSLPPALMGAPLMYFPGRRGPTALVLDHRAHLVTDVPAEALHDSIRKRVLVPIQQEQSSVGLTVLALSLKESIRSRGVPPEMESAWSIITGGNSHTPVVTPVSGS